LDDEAKESVEEILTKLYVMLFFSFFHIVLFWKSENSVNPEHHQTKANKENHDEELSQNSYVV